MLEYWVVMALALSILAAILVGFYQSQQMPRAAVIVFRTWKRGFGYRIVKVIIKVNQTLPIGLSITDKAGNPASVDGIPAWSLSDSSLGAIEASSDGMAAVFTPAGKLGDLQVQVSADADLGAGVNTIIGALAVTIAGGDAAVVTLAGGAPVDF